ncbi:MAG: small subunit ribosomal protein [Patescibacteria group bacterium]|nr:small subunit ribosomal protein [Patescibacteria group bacterium]
MKNKQVLKNIDYKDIDTLKKFINNNGRILSRRKNSLSATQQKEMAQAIKRARFMGLIPYIAK